VDYAALSTNPNEVKAFATKSDCIQEVIVDHGIGTNRYQDLIWLKEKNIVNSIVVFN
jgi:hypothetical protein